MGKKFHFPVKPGSVRAQGMVEFALALPVFLVLVFGVIEAGHLLMTYSAVYSAAREGARYGAAIGTSGNGMDYAHDCDGMKAAAVRVGFLGGVQTSSITIRMFQKSPTSTDWVLKQDASGATIGNLWCTQSNASWTTSMSDRIEVEVAVNYAPIVPLVPIAPLTVNGSDGGVRSKSSRTLVQDVSLEGVIIPTATLQLFHLDLSTIGGGTATASPTAGGGSYQVGTTVTLTATPNTCWDFAGWTINGVNIGTAVTTVTMDRDVIARATFTQPTYQLTLNSLNASVNPLTGGPYPGNGGEIAEGPGGAVTTGGHYTGPISCGSHSFTANPDSSYFFYNWSGSANGAANPLTIDVHSDITLNASFTTPDPPRKLTVNSNLPNGGIISYDNPDPALVPNLYPGSYYYLPSGTVVNLGVTANAGYGFVNWTGDLTSTSPNLAVTLNGDVTVTANYGTLLSTATAGCGSLTCSAGIVSATGQTIYSAGQSATVQATAGNGVTFVNWTDASGRVAASSANPYTFSYPAGAPLTLTANFIRIPYTLTVTYNIQGAGTASPSGGTYYYGDPLTITPTTIAAGYRFLSWDANGVPGTVMPGNNALKILSVVGNMNPILNFEAYCAPLSQLTVSIPTGSQSAYTANVANVSGIPVHMTSLTATWNNTQKLTSVTLNGSTMWSSPTGVTSGTAVPLAQSVSIPKASNFNSLILSFGGNVNNVSITNVGYSSSDLCP